MHREQARLGEVKSEEVEMMKKSRRAIKSVLDLGRVPVTPVKRDDQYETRDEFFAREAREEQERKDAPLRKLVGDCRKQDCVQHQKVDP